MRPLTDEGRYDDRVRRCSLQWNDMVSFNVKTVSLFPTVFELVLKTTRCVCD